MTLIPLNHAALKWNEQGAPVSKVFNDVYFSNENGLAETRYVFLQGNRLPERWYSHDEQLFTIAETGFGTGLNFLTLWQSFCQFRRGNPATDIKSLHFISFEQYPLSFEDLCNAHKIWPELASFAIQLQQQWPQPLPGRHLLQFNDEITLELWFGDVNETLPQLMSTYQNSVDSWFLDGFAPAKNPTMWNNQLFNLMYKFTKPHGTFATFTAAGFVRRGLQEAGFQVERIKGFGHKREMLAGIKM